ncbi:unnamed protein product [Brassica rapa]|uniref:Uncharacterized protein n=2 Tax=Brassica TaxID=3705 RepID=A0A3P6AF43_BRACM|nr:unnamed protein product [Brassica napus]CAG7883765.1 unnamed protein product [Brassica rapa]VDC82938.1 unnamed protein product [Brassica rapa]
MEKAALIFIGKHGQSICVDTDCECPVQNYGALPDDTNCGVAACIDYCKAKGEERKYSSKSLRAGESVLRKAEDVVSSMLAKGFILGKDAIAKAKSVEEKHQLTSTASAKVASLDKKLGFHRQDQHRNSRAIAATEQSVSNAGSAIMKNRYVLTGATWVTGAFNKVAKVAEEVGQKAKEKVGMAEEEDKRKVVDEFARVHLSESPKINV